MRRELLLLVVLFATPAAARPSAATFSDLCTEAQSGDVAGRFVRLDRQAGGAAVTYGYTEGSLMAPVRGRRVRYQPTTGALFFTVKTWTPVRFQGRVTAHALLGRLRMAGAKRPEVVRLARVDGVQGPYPSCLSGR